MLIKLLNRSNNPLPKYESKNSAGMDLRAFIESKIVLFPLERKLVKTGLSVQLPQGIEAQVRPRSGLALKHGITVLNSPGTIDSDYRGEIGVILINLSDHKFEINNGDRVAQLVFAKHESIEFQTVESLENTARGKAGLGRTGIQ